MAEHDAGVQTVPADPGERERVRAGARRLVRELGLVPPVDLEELSAHATVLRARLDLPPGHQHFATVLLGNAVWEDLLAAVPVHRRLLLLPRCLRHPERCQGVVDELGLTCLRCGSCPIGALDAEAEALGAPVLVAEGTSAAGRLVEAGRVEGVVAVACLHSLERSFAAASAGAVPAVGVPLLAGGCRGTSLDLDWARGAISRHSGEPGPWRLDLDRLRRQVAAWFEPAPLRAVLGGDGTITEELALTAIAAGGKRWRPLLAAAAWQALTASREEPPEPVRRIAVAIECFHKASLVHDDIEDGDLERNGRPALHAAHGIPAALNAGDLLIGEGYRLIAEAGLPGELTARMLAAAARAHRELCLGQGEELAWTRDPGPLPVERALAMLRRKTAPAFELGLVLGALAAGADASTCDALRALAAALGVAYQIRDDIEDQGTESTAAPSPVLVALAAEAGDGRLARLLATGRLDDEARHGLPGLQTDAWRLFEGFRQQSLRALRPLRQQPLKALLSRLVHLFLGGSGVAAGATPTPAPATLPAASVAAEAAHVA